METVQKTSLSGSLFGRWTVLDDIQTTEKGERKWLCLCACGTRRYVLERSLKSGGSRSCGCLRAENAEKALVRDLSGKTFGRLRVLSRKEGKKGGGVRWLCRCSCGRECTSLATLLICGRKTSCGRCVKKKTNSKDVAAQRFGRLTAIFPTEKRDAKGNVLWHCRCDCGNELDVSYNALMYTHLVSCGCSQREHGQMLREYLTHVDGTSLEMLKSERIPKNNTTGVKGVYRVRGRYMAKIVFQKKQYQLGIYDSLDEAAQARREAEEIINRGVVAFYQKWKARAQTDPDWAKENPVRLIVNRSAEGRLSLVCLPRMEEYRA